MNQKRRPSNADEIIGEEVEYYTPSTIFPHHNYKSINIIEGKSYPITLRTISLVIVLLEDYDVPSALHVMNCQTLEEFNMVMNVVNKPRWLSPDLTTDFYESLDLSDDEIQELKSSEKTFDINRDYDAYYLDFYKLGIDLFEEDICFFKFQMLLDRFIEDERSNIARRLKFRGYSASKHEDEGYKTAMYKQKSKYALTSNGLKLEDYEEVM